MVILDEIEDFDIFSTELGEVLEFIKDSADKKEMETLLNTNKKLSVMSSESVNAINRLLKPVLKNFSLPRMNCLHVWRKQGIRYQSIKIRNAM